MKTRAYPTVRICTVAPLRPYTKYPSPDAPLAAPSPRLSHPLSLLQASQALSLGPATPGFRPPTAAQSPPLPCSLPHSSPGGSLPFHSLPPSPFSTDLHCICLLQLRLPYTTFPGIFAPTAASGLTGFHPATAAASSCPVDLTPIFPRGINIAELRPRHITTGPLPPSNSCRDSRYRNTRATIPPRSVLTDSPSSRATVRPVAIRQKHRHD